MICRFVDVESRSGPALYVHFRAAVGCLAGLVRLVSADVRDGADVNAWLVHCLFRGWNSAFGRGNLPWADGR